MRWIPWRLSPDSDPQQRFIVTTEDGETEICGIVKDEETAKLIAAAPELVEALIVLVEAAVALQQCVDQYDDHPGGVPVLLLEAAEGVSPPLVQATAILRAVGVKP